METARKIYAPHELQPSEPIHPGEMLKDELEARGISQRKFAQTIGVSYSVLNEVVNGKRPITCKTRSGNCLRDLTPNRNNSCGCVVYRRFGGRYANSPAR